MEGIDFINCYAVLGVAHEASLKDINSAYKKLALKYHPDKAGDGKDFANEFRKIQQAIEILRDPIRRQQHDKQLGKTIDRYIRTDDGIFPPGYTGWTPYHGKTYDLRNPHHRYMYTYGYSAHEDPNLNESREGGDEQPSYETEETLERQREARRREAMSARVFRDEEEMKGQEENKEQGDHSMQASSDDHSEYDGEETEGAVAYDHGQHEKEGDEYHNDQDGGSSNHDDKAEDQDYNDYGWDNYEQGEGPNNYDYYGDDDEEEGYDSYNPLDDWREHLSVDSLRENLPTFSDEECFLEDYQTELDGEDGGSVVEPNDEDDLESVKARHDHDSLDEDEDEDGDSEAEESEFEEESNHEADGEDDGDNTAYFSSREVNPSLDGDDETLAGIHDDDDDDDDGDHQYAASNGTIGQDKGHEEEDGESHEKNCTLDPFIPYFRAKLSHPGGRYTHEDLQAELKGIVMETFCGWLESVRTSFSTAEPLTLGNDPATCPHLGLWVKEFGCPECEICHRWRPIYMLSCPSCGARACVVCKFTGDC